MNEKNKGQLDKGEIPVNKRSFLIKDLIIQPCILLLLFMGITEFGTIHIYNYLATIKEMNELVKAEFLGSLNGLSYLEIYSIHYIIMHAGVLFILGLFSSFNIVVPGFGRQLFIKVTVARLNKLAKGKAINGFKRTAKADFPPTFSMTDKKYILAKRGLDKEGDTSSIILGNFKRMNQDIDADRRDKQKTEKYTDYKPLIISRMSRFRHTLVTGGSGSGKTASYIAPCTVRDNLDSKTSTITWNPKADEYLLRCSLKSVIARRETPFHVNELKTYLKTTQGNMVGFYDWYWEKHGKSAKPYGFISLANPHLSVGYDPLAFGDADQITKKIIESSDAMDNAFYKSQQSTWCGSLIEMFLSDRDLKGRMGLKHVFHCSIEPKTRIPGLFEKIVDVDVVTKFPELKEKIRNKTLSAHESEMIRKHEDNRGRYKNISKMSAENLGGLSAHIAQFIEDQSISAIFVDNDKPILDFRNILSKGGVVYIEVPTQSKGAQSRALSRMLMMELQALSAARDMGRETKDCDIIAYIDEFGSLVYNEFINMIDKARSARVGLVLAHQSVANLKKDHLSDSFLGEIMDNTATKIVLNIMDVNTREYFKKTLGQQTVLRESISEAKNRSTGSGRSAGLSKGLNKTLKEEEVYVVNENDFSVKLGNGYASVLNEDQSMSRGKISIGYVDENDCPEYGECKRFLKNELMFHAKREKPLYDIGMVTEIIQKEVTKNGEQSFKDQEIMVQRLLDENGDVVGIAGKREEKREDMEYYDENELEEVEGIAFEEEVPDVVEEPQEIEVPDVVEEPQEIEVPDVVEEPQEIEVPDVVEEPQEIEIPDVIEEPQESEKKELEDDGAFF
jgi:hypothetical protein